MEIYILVGIYLISVFLARKHIKIAHQKGGIWYNLNIGRTEVIITLAPFLNTFYCIIGWILFYPKELKKNKRDFSRFFNIKK